MKIAIFGASGRTGHFVMEMALLGGHDVVAFARRPENVRLSHERLTVIEGTIADRERIERAVEGADAVIELMGAVSKGTENIIAAMKKHRVRRLIAASALSVSDPKDRFQLGRQLLLAMVRMIIPRNVKEVRRAAELVRASDLEWTLARIPILTDKPGGFPKADYYGHGMIGIKLTRADLAAFLYGQLMDTRFIRQAPAVSSGPSNNCL
ncbi:putative NAD(P)-binding protein [Paenibacillus cellulosilyticus]|uniref:Putative NAD(P)-binding protein n=1 Tax=Paenibacillus cellulosilyticus TaxID=375489 RepID=A0A2V2YU09_9BACL|nr:NAD(P)H-binding protein [Paenibacillus cellulosilyticus]PWW02426.1 putative NAD(P)-binding protein [Paenibacillus cellulosilyticus]QKS47137.1 NAD(P)H-binding protein [Paenibacillus cellulosilyticus]